MTIALLLGFAQVCFQTPDLTPEKQFAYDAVPDLPRIVSKYQRVRTSFTPEATAYRKLKEEITAINYSTGTVLEVQTKFSSEFVRQNLSAFKVALTDTLFKRAESAKDPFTFENCMYIAAKAPWDQEIKDIVLARYAFGLVCPSDGIGSPPMLVLRTRRADESAEQFTAYIDSFVSTNASYARVEELARKSKLYSNAAKIASVAVGDDKVLGSTRLGNNLGRLASNVAFSLKEQSNPELLDNLRRAFRKLGQDDQRRVIRILKTDTFDPRSEK